MAMEMVSFGYRAEIEDVAIPSAGRTEFKAGAERRTFEARFAVDQDRGIEVAGTAHQERFLLLDDYERAVAREMRVVLDRDVRRRQGLRLDAAELGAEDAGEIDPVLLATGWRPGDGPEVV